MRNRILAVIAFVLVAASLGRAANNEPGKPLAGVTANGYWPDSQTVAFRTVSTIAVADATAIATLTSTTTGRFAINGRPNFSVSGRFSSAAATCKIRVLYSFVDPSTGVEVPYELSNEVTLTATSFTDSAGLFVSQPFVFDGAGATHVRPILSGGTSAGTVALWCGSR